MQRRRRQGIQWYVILWGDMVHIFIMSRIYNTVTSLLQKWKSNSLCNCFRFMFPRYVHETIQWPASNGIQRWLKKFCTQCVIFSLTTNLTFFYFHQCGSSEARKSLNRPVAQELYDNLIYNIVQLFMQKKG